MNNTTRLPQNFIEYKGEILMSNYDGLIAEQTANEIKGKELFSRYAGWNFNGKVWWRDNKWLCEIWCYHNWQGTIMCDTLEEIMQEIVDEYGTD